MRHDPQGAGGEDQGDGGQQRPAPGDAAGVRGQDGQQGHAPHPVVGPADRRDQQGRDGGDQDAPGVQATAQIDPAGGPEAGDGGEQRRHGPDETGLRVVQHPGDHALERLVVDDPCRADPAGLEHPPGPELDAGVGQEQQPGQHRYGEPGEGGGGGLHPAGDQEIDGEDRGGEFDACREAGGEALEAGAVRAGEVPQDQAGEGEVDLAEDEGLEDRFEPEAEGGGGQQGGRGAGGLAQAGGLDGEVDQQGEQDRVDEYADDLEGGEREPAGGDEQQGGKGRVGGRKVPFGDREPIEVTAGRGGIALRAVDGYVGHRERLDLVEHPQPGERHQEQCGRDHQLAAGRDALRPGTYCRPGPRPVRGRHPSTPPS